MNNSLCFEDWGRIEYTKALALQKQRVEELVRAPDKNYLIFCEHDSVITLGRGTLREETFVSGDIPSINVERGGLATYHGPGQLVGYPILKLSPKSESICPGGIRELVCIMEKSIIELLSAYNIKAESIPKKTGVWIGGQRKIASIGIAVSHWVSYHGFALNISTNKEHWKFINPCGFSSGIMTNLQDETNLPIDFVRIKGQLKEILISKLEPSGLRQSNLASEFAL
ncbi:lipoyl(octanoyl) transferase LipB [bacterium]|nr:lipoyl(octanoyl) transferase LipB [bacterium]